MAQTRRRSKQSARPITADQMAVYEFFFKWGFMFVILVASLYGCWWILSELFKETTTESDKWKYSGLGALVISVNIIIVRYFFPKNR